MEKDRHFLPASNSLLRMPFPLRAAGVFCPARGLSTASSGSQTACRCSLGSSPRVFVLSPSWTTACASWCGWIWTQGPRRFSGGGWYDS
jgi:hypothetical protein